MLRPRPLILACGLLCSAGAARAENKRYSLFYLAAEGCPSAEHFAAELSARAPWLVEAEGDAPLSIEVSFEDSTPLNGVLVLRDADGQTTTRTVPGTSCAEVVSALALITTVLIDAQRDQPAPAPAPPPPTVPERRPPPPVAARPPAPERSRVRFGFGAGAGVNGGVGPNPALGGVFEFSTEWHARGAFSPQASLSAESTLPSDSSRTDGEASFRWTVLRASACPWRLRAGAALAFRPCALFEGGILEADGSGIEAATSARAPWWSVGAAARVELTLVDPLAVVLEAGGRYHLRQDSFYFASGLGESTVFAVPAGGAFARLTVHARW